MRQFTIGLLFLSISGQTFANAAVAAELPVRSMAKGPKQQSAAVAKPALSQVPRRAILPSSLQKQPAVAKPRNSSATPRVAETKFKPPVISPSRSRPSHHSGPFVVAIDAGHGGKDTGAIGSRGVLEKDVVFAIAKKLQGMINAQPNFRAVMVRKADEFIELRERAEIARKAKADLFISLHADAYENGEVRGSSVFTLSRSGATSEAARWLADSENAADLVGGVKLKGRGKLLASVLLDLSQNAAMEASDKAAVNILRELKKNSHMHHPQVQKAGFVVLKSPDVPSLLVETAFISNTDEEKNLLNPQYQNSVAKAVFNGIRTYASRSAPPASLEPGVASTATAEAPVRYLAQH